jgi:hypothetical protein
VGCNCTKKNTMYEAVSAEGKRLFGPSPFKTTVEAMAARHTGAAVRAVGEATASAEPAETAAS